MNLNVLVSIIVPCYNQAEYLDECLQSILSQTYVDWECIIVNDGSSDNTEQIAQKWLLKDRRFKYYYQDNKGVSSARNLGLENVKGKFIQFLDSDDILDNCKIEISVNALKNKNNLIITNFKTFSNDIKKAVEHPNFLKSNFFNFESILYDWGLNFNIPIHCGFFSNDFFNDFRFSTHLKGNEDWIMWLYIFKKEPAVFFIDRPLVYYRSHIKSATKDLNIMKESYFKAVKYTRNILSEEEYSDYLISLLSEKNEVINRLENQIKRYQQSKGYRMLKKIKENKLGKLGIKYILKLIKK